MGVGYKSCVCNVFYTTPSFHARCFFGVGPLRGICTKMSKNRLRQAIWQDMSNRVRACTEHCVRHETPCLLGKYAIRQADHMEPRAERMAPRGKHATPPRCSRVTNAAPLHRCPIVRMKIRRRSVVVWALAGAGAVAAAQGDAAALLESAQVNGTAPTKLLAKRGAYSGTATWYDVETWVDGYVAVTYQCMWYTD